MLLDEVTGRFPGLRIVVVGDVMLDEYQWGDATRLSAEAPVPVVEVREQSAAAGGAGNAAANVASLGGTAVLGGVVGTDDTARRLAAVLREAGVDTAGLASDAGRPTTAKIRVFGGNQQVVRIDHEKRHPISAAMEDRLIDWAEQALTGADGCILSDYGKGVVSPRLARAVIGLARKRGIAVVVDPKGTDYSKYRGATVVKPNVVEVERVLRHEIGDAAALDGAGRRLVDLLEGTAVLVTRGPAGMALFRAGSQALHFQATARQVYDVTGAGDTVVAAVAMALAAGAALEDAIALAGRAAGLAVGLRGTAAVTLAALRANA